MLDGRGTLSHAYSKRVTYSDTFRQAGKDVAWALPRTKTFTTIVNPPTKTIGQRLGDIIDLIFTPAELAKIYKDNAVEKFKKRLSEKIVDIPEEKRVPPPLNVVGPAVEAAKYHIEDVALREMFANLIARAINSDTSQLVHPAFIEIIKQLSPIEAKLLELVLQMGTFKVPTLSLHCSNDKEEFLLIRNYTILDGHSYFGNYEAEPRQTCYDNFERLGLIKLYETRPTIDSNGIYEFLEMQLESVKQDKKLNKMYNKMKFVRGHYLITTYGCIFAKCCMNPADGNISNDYISKNIYK